MRPALKDRTRPCTTNKRVGRGRRVRPHGGGGGCGGWRACPAGSLTVARFHARITGIENMTQAQAGRSAGLDFGTTNTVAALASGREQPRLVKFDGPSGGDEVFRSALCFWQDEGERGGLAVEAGAAAIREYLEFPSDSRFLQSFKSVAASPIFESAS